MPGRKTIPAMGTLADHRKLMPPDYEYNYFEDAAAHPLRLAAKRFERINACWMSELSLLVYASDTDFIRDQIAKILPQAHVEFIGFEAGFFKSTQCMVVHDAAHIVVVFRGTIISHGWDVAVDLMSVPVRWELPGKVHMGFLSATNEVYAPLTAYLKKIHKPGMPIWITGHSLGAAVGTLFAQRFHQGVAPLAGLYTFGSPHVGNHEFAHSYTVPTYRVINGKDIVTTLPSAKLGGARFAHVGDPKYIDTRGRLHHANRPDEKKMSSMVQKMALASKITWQKRQMYRRIGDHAPKCYAIRLWNAYLATKN